MSARFDLLATCFALGALYCMTRGGHAQSARRRRSVLLVPCSRKKRPSLCRLPLPPGALSACVRRHPERSHSWCRGWWRSRHTARLRHLAGGVSAVGGASRLPKLAGVHHLPWRDRCDVVRDGGSRLRDWLRPRRTQCAAVALVARHRAVARLPRFARAHRDRSHARSWPSRDSPRFTSSSPVLAPGESIFSDPTAPAAWIVGAVAIIAVGAIIFFLWRRLIDDDRYWFLRCIAHRHAVADIRADRGQALSVSAVGRDVADRRHRRR